MRGYCIPVLIVLATALVPATATSGTTDLEISGFANGYRVQPAPAGAPGPYTVDNMYRFTAANLGDTDVPAIRVKFTGSLLGLPGLTVTQQRDIGGLLAEESKEFLLAVNGIPSPYVCALLDSPNAVAESNEENNEACALIEGVQFIP